VFFVQISWSIHQFSWLFRFFSARNFPHGELWAFFSLLSVYVCFFVSRRHHGQFLEISSWFSPIISVVLIGIYRTVFFFLLNIDWFWSTGCFTGTGAVIKEEMQLHLSTTDWNETHHTRAARVYARMHWLNDAHTNTWGMQCVRTASTTELINVLQKCLFVRSIALFPLHPLLSWLTRVRERERNQYRMIPLLFSMLINYYNKSTTKRSANIMVREQSWQPDLSLPS